MARSSFVFATRTMDNRFVNVFDFFNNSVPVSIVFTFLILICWSFVVCKLSHVFYRLLLCLLFSTSLMAQTPVDGLKNQKLVKVTNDGESFGTISFPGEIMDVGFRLTQLRKMNWRDYQSVEFKFVVHDLDENIISQGTAASINKGKGLKWVRFDPAINESHRGWFRVHLYVIGSRDQKSVWLGEGQVDVAILPPLAKHVDQPYVGVSMPNSGGAGAYLSAVNILALERLGIKQIRTFLRWYDIQPHENQPPDWRLIDRIVNQAHKSGITVLPAVVGTPDWAVDSDALKDRGIVKQGQLAAMKTLRPDAQKFASFLTLLVDRYKDRVHEWSIWNEPNTLSSLNNRSAKDYARIIQVAYTAIKSADPQALVAMAGLSGVKAGYLREIVNYGAGASIEAVCIHPYRYPQAMPELATIGIKAGYGLEKLLDDLAKLKQVIKEMPATTTKQTSRPIWATEGGYNTLSSFKPALHQAVTTKQQAQLLVRSMALANVGGVSRYYWWRLFDTYGAHMGILSNQSRQHQPKPAYVALAVFERLAGDMKTVAYEQKGSIHRIHYISRNKPMTLIWTTNEPQQVQLQSTQALSATTMMGQSFEIKDSSLQVSQSPIYLANHVNIKP